MTPVLVDSNVILDVATQDPVWAERSGLLLAREAETAQLVINPIIFAEVSAGFEGIEQLDAALPPELFRREHSPWEAAFLAGYRLLTRDVARYRTCFPGLEILAP